MRNNPLKTILYISIVTILTGAACSSRQAGSTIHVTSKEDSTHYRDLGFQVMQGSIQGGAFYKDASGKEYVYTVSRGNPAHLLGYDLKKNRLITNLPLDHEVGAWDLEVTSDGLIYIAGNKGHLFQHRPGSNVVNDLGSFNSELLIYDLSPGKDGEIYGGTWPTASVFRYHPKDGFSDIGKGTMEKGEQYVRSIAYHAKTGKIYAGIGAHASLVELDPKTGLKKQLLPAEFKHHEFVYNLSLVPGFSDGDRLFVWLHSGDKQETLIYNLQTGKFFRRPGILQVRSVAKDPNSDKIYYRGRGMVRTDNVSSEIDDRALPTDLRDSTTVDAMWGQDKHLYMLTALGHIIKYNPSSNRTSLIKLAIPEEPLKIHNVVTGPDGRIWTAGYLAGGHAAYDPKTNEIKQYPGIDQSEGMTVQGQNIYLGVYPTARMYVFDTKRKWNPEKGNPRLIKQIAGQDRPFAGASAEDIGQMFFGTIPRYGHLGGTLLQYDVKTDVMDVYHDVIPNQSIASLIYHKGILYGGSTIRGGIGIDASEKEARFFAWDPITRKKLFDMVPVPGTRSLTCLINGPDDNIWGISDGVLFIYNPDRKEITTRKPLYKAASGKDGVFFDARLVVHPNGLVYGTGSDNFFHIDPKTLKYTALRKGARLLAMDKDGNIYTVINETLWQYRP